MEATQRRDGVVTATSSPPTPTLTVAAVARRLGVAPPTLRTWDRRYGLGPSAHTAGAHRRYSPADVARLMVMRRLTLEGVSPADAAKIAVATPVSADGRPMHTPSEGLSFADLPEVDDDGAAGPADARPAERNGSDGAPADLPDSTYSDASLRYPHESNDQEPGDVASGDVESGDRPGPTRPAVLPAAWAATTGVDPRPDQQNWIGILRSVGPERGTAGGGRVVAMPDGTPQNRGLARAAMSLDTYETHRIIRDAVRREGVVSTWNGLILPVLRALGERTRVTGDGIDVEHAFSEVILAVMRAVAFDQQPRGPVTVLLACAEADHHSLPLYALAAALAERDLPTRMLGSGVPAHALSAAVRRTGPSVVVLFARVNGADASETETLRRQRPAPAVILAGPGWLPETVPAFAHTASSLIEAVDEVLRAVHA